MKALLLRNPVGRKAKRRTTSAAIRRKISLAVKRANKNRSVSRPATKSVARRRSASKSVARRSSSISPATRRKISAALRRRGGRRNISRRISGAVGGFSLKNVFNKDNLTVAGGVVLAQVATSYVFANYGDKLPGVKGSDGKVNTSVLLAYQVLIPIAAGYLAKRFNQKLAAGLMIGGVASGLSGLVGMIKKPAAPAATTAATTTANAYLSPGRPAPTPAYQATNVFNGSANPFARNGGGAGSSAFKTSAWGR